MLYGNLIFVGCSRAALPLFHFLRAILLLLRLCLFCCVAVARDATVLPGGLSLGASSEGHSPSDMDRISEQKVLIATAK